MCDHCRSAMTCLHTSLPSSNSGLSSSSSNLSSSSQSGQRSCENRIMLCFCQCQRCADKRKINNPQPSSTSTPATLQPIISIELSSSFRKLIGREDPSLIFCKMPTGTSNMRKCLPTEGCIRCKQTKKTTYGCLFCCYLCFATATKTWDGKNDTMLAATINAPSLYQTGKKEMQLSRCGTIGCTKNTLPFSQVQGKR